MNTLQLKKDQFQKLLKKTEQKFGKGPSANWKNKDFENLSFEINLKSKILISPATLKRLFGKVKTSANYSPQESTIEALKIYAEYDPETKEEQRARAKMKPVYFVFAAVFMGIFTWFLFSDKPEKVVEKGTLQLVKIEGKGTATAHFNCTIPRVKDSIFFNYGDQGIWTPIKNTTTKLTHVYSVPGLLTAEVRTRKQLLTNPLKVFVPTNGWQALVHYFGKDDIERYYPVPFEGNVTDGVFHASRKNLSDVGINPSEIVILRIDNYIKTGKNGDSFHLKSRFKNGSFWPGVRCYSVYYTIQGELGQINFKFVGEGCSGYAKYKLSEKHNYGGGTDLSDFAIDLQNWSDLEVTNKEKHVTVKLGDSVVLNDSYKKSIGEILGITVYFHGSGSVDYIHLNDANNAAIFCEEFEQ